nr:hypothetical protein 3 [signal crayfish associated hepe-like virus 1]
MEDVTIASSSRPTGSVIVDKTVQDANFYGTPSGIRPVEDTEIFFKELVGSISAATSDPRGTLLLTIDLDFQHGENFAARKTNYGYIKYKELKITGKRTDIVFGRSGSIGIVYTTNPWYKLSTDDPAANAVAVASDPTYRVLTISDHLEVDIMKNIKDQIRANEWYFNHAGEGMPLDYYMAGKVFILVESPPQLLPYQIPVYTAGSVAVRDYLPTELSTLTFEKHYVDAPITEVTLNWQKRRSEYAVVAYITSPQANTNVGEFILDDSLNGTIVVRETPQDGDDVDNAPTEHHQLSDFPIAIFNEPSGAMLDIATTVSKLSNFMEPELVEHNLTHVRGWAVYQTSHKSRQAAVRGIPLDKIPVGAPSIPRSAFIRAAGIEAVSNLARVARNQRPVVVTRPAGDVDLLGMARMHVNQP